MEKFALFKVDILIIYQHMQPLIGIFNIVALPQLEDVFEKNTILQLLLAVHTNENSCSKLT